jgi:hypothetical protein
MAIRYVNIFQSKALNFFPKLVFWFENKPSGSPDVELQVKARNSFAADDRERGFSGVHDPIREQRFASSELCFHYTERFFESAAAAIPTYKRLSDMPKNTK